MLNPNLSYFSFNLKFYIAVPAHPFPFAPSCLIRGSYLKKGESILLTGATWLRKELSRVSPGKYNTHKTIINRMEGSFLKFFDKLAKANLLILNDYGLAHIDRKQQMDLIEDHHGGSSTIIASQLPVGGC